MKVERNKEKQKMSTCPPAMDPDSMVPVRIPGFEWKDDEGIIHHTDGFKGQSIMIILFSVKCNHCKKLLEQIASGLKSLPVKKKVLWIGRNHKKNELTSYFIENNLPFHNLIEDPEALIYNMFARRGIPKVFLYNEKGYLQSYIRGFNSDEINRIIRSFQSPG